MTFLQNYKLCGKMCRTISRKIRKHYIKKMMLTDLSSMTVSQHQTVDIVKLLLHCTVSVVDAYSIHRKNVVESHHTLRVLLA